MKFKFTSIHIFFSVLTFMVSALSLSSHIQSSSGKTGTTKKQGQNAGGCFCHYPDAENFVGVGIKGPNVVAPGSTSEYIVWVTKGANKAGGFNVASWAGQLSSSDPYAALIVDELTQSYPKAPRPGTDTISWTFNYKAPDTAGTDTLYATGINVDSAFDTDNDHWNYSPNFVVNVSSATNLNEEESSAESVCRLFPNPAASIANLEFKVNKGERYDIQIQSANGYKQYNLKSDFFNTGRHTIQLNTENYPAGDYKVVLKSGTKTIVKSLLIVH